MAIESPEKTAAGASTHTIVHYEIPAQDAGKLTAFYSQVFGWKFASAPGMETYFMASTTESDSGAGVAIYPREADDTRPCNYISVASVEAFGEKIEQAGGRVIHHFTVPGMGHGAVALDPEGNPVGIWQGDDGAAAK
jgi:uncharacterized protein